MLTCALTSVLALLLPSSDSGAATRRATLKSAASAALLPLLSTPQATRAIEGQDADIGFSGALRNDIGESLKGSGVEVLVTDLSYKELSACPGGFFVPAKGGPWSCLEITCTLTNNVRNADWLRRARWARAAGAHVGRPRHAFDS